MAMNNEATVWYQKALCEHGYHVYKEIAEAATGETLVYVAEPANSRDKNVLAVEKNDKVTGHLPQKCYTYAFCSKERWKPSLHSDYMYYSSLIFCQANCLRCSSFHGINFCGFV